MKPKTPKTSPVKIESTGRNLDKKSHLGDPFNAASKVTATIIVKRRTDTVPIKTLDQFQQEDLLQRKILSHDEFRDIHGAAQADVDLVVKFANDNNLDVLDNNLARRSVVVRGSVAQINKAFGIALHQVATHQDRKSYSGFVHLPASVANVVEHIIGLDDQPVHAKHYTANPPDTTSLTPQQVAKLYNFPTGDGAGQTIGIYEMKIGNESPGYNLIDIGQTLAGFGGGLSVPSLTAVPVDGQANTNISDGETLLDITVSGAIAQKANIAVYFTGDTTQNMVHALQAMIHPGAGDPVPTILSISYGWGPDDDTQIMSPADYGLLSTLFQDAAQMGITVLVSSGDSGPSLSQGYKYAQASYPASDPWVLACGGTTIGDITAGSFAEYVWNNPPTDGATGGGVSAFFAVPPYQNGIAIPKRNAPKGNVGRGLPDVAGNAGPASGYTLYLRGQAQQTGGTSAVAPLYAGLIAVVNSLLGGNKAGFLNPSLYKLGNQVCRDIASPPGPANNNYNGVKGYPCVKGWDACTGLGAIDGGKLLTALQAALAAPAAQPV